MEVCNALQTKYVSQHWFTHGEYNAVLQTKTFNASESWSQLRLQSFHHFLDLSCTIDVD